MARYHYVANESGGVASVAARCDDETCAEPHVVVGAPVDDPFGTGRTHRPVTVEPGPT